MFRAASCIVFHYLDLFVFLNLLFLLLRYAAPTTMVVKSTELYNNSNIIERMNNITVQGINRPQFTLFLCLS